MIFHFIRYLVSPLFLKVIRLASLTPVSFLSDDSVVKVSVLLVVAVS